MARTGRRAGTTQTRQDILETARECFAKDGYSGATIRAIAAGARVDPALVHHYFGTKQRLFVEALEMPKDPASLVATVLEGDRTRVGERAVRAFLSVWDDAEGRERIRALLRSAVTAEHAARMLREFFVESLFRPVARRLEIEHAELRVNLVASQMLGLALARYVMRFEPLASADRDAVVAAVGPTVQRYLTGNLDG